MKALPIIVTEEPPTTGPRDGLMDKNAALGEYAKRTLSAVHVNPPSTETSRATDPPTETEAGEIQTTEVEDKNWAETLWRCECNTHAVHLLGMQLTARLTRICTMSKSSRSRNP
jgi:hypothetical protein